MVNIKIYEREGNRETEKTNRRKERQEGKIKW